MSLREWTQAEHKFTKNSTEKSKPLPGTDCQLHRSLSFMPSQLCYIWCETSHNSTKTILIQRCIKPPSLGWERFGGKDVH